MFSIFIIFDIILIVFSIYLVKKTALHILNPFLFYIIYHISFVTFRISCWIVLNDSPLYYLPISVNFNENVLLKSFILEIISLITFLISYIYIYSNKKTVGNLKISSIRIVPKILIIISLVLFLFFSNIFGYQLFEFDTSKSLIGTFIISIMNWFILLLTLGYFIDNPKNKKLFFFIVISAITIQAFQGYGRWRLMVDVMFLLILFYVKNGLSFPKIKLIHLIFIVFGLIIYSNLKYLGLILFVAQNSSDLPSLSTFVSNLFNGDMPFIFNIGDLFIIDHQASLIKAIDYQGFFFGKTYISNFDMFMPKYLFPNKNSVNYWLIELKTNSQLFQINGSIPTLIGESYANFGYLGPIFVIFLISSIANYYFFKLIYSIKNKLISYELIFYCAFYLSFFQIIRDGFNSVINFMFFTFFPLLFFKLLNVKFNLK
jgi:hypothetical protein